MISYHIILQISNEDGNWVLLNSESVERYCQKTIPYIEAWSMRVNKYLNNEKFLVPVNGAKRESNKIINEKHTPVVIPPTLKVNRET